MPTVLTCDNTQLTQARETDLQLIANPENELIGPVSDRLAALIECSISENTRRAYRCDLDQFLAWGGSIPANPQTVAEYAAWCAPTAAVATVARRLVAIGKAHSTQGLASPCSSDLVKHAMRGIRRAYGKPQRQVTAAVREDVLKMVAGLGQGPRDLRNRALVLIGFAGAFRRSELVALRTDDLEWLAQGVVILIRRSKTDQEGQGRKVAIPFGRGKVCPVSALREWLDAAGITEGPLFRSVDRHGVVGERSLSGSAVAESVKELAAAVGFDPGAYSGHSLRSGLATSAAALGVSSWKIKAQTGHRSDATLGRYIRDGQLFRDNAAGAVL